AIFIPVVLAICSGMGISPRRLMMPLSVAGLISGMMTLIATPPNLVAHSELVKSGFEGFNFFSFTPIGLIILVMGIGYMLIARRWLDNGEQSNTHSQAQKFSMSQLIEEYQLKERAKMVLVEADSDCVGKSIGQLNLRIEQGLNIIAIQRTKRFRKITVSASVNEIFQPKDILLLDTALDDETYQQRCEQLKLRPIELKGEYFSSQYRSVGMAEISVMPEAECIGKTIRELKFRSRYHLSIVGLKRGDEIIQEELLDTPLKFGDILLVMGVWQQIHRMDDDHRDFFLLRDPAESKNAPPALSQAPHALFSVLTMVLLMITGIVPNVMAALIACLMLGKFRCVDMKSAYDSIHMPSIVLIVGMMPFSIALQKTGGVDLTVRLLLDAMQGLDVHFVLIVLFVVTAIISAFISNTATAILVMPIAIAIANQLGYSPAPFVMTVAVSASAAFMTPVSSPVNTMVLAPAGYKFIDFVKVGVPFTVLVMLVSVFVIPMLFPL
ncbi:SLC13 family permease, partial [Mannheimia haemolytica]